MLGDLAIVHPAWRRLYRNGSSGLSGDPQKLPFVRAVIGLERGHDLAIGGLPVNDGVEIRKCGSQSVIKRAAYRFVGRSVSAVAYGRGSLSAKSFLEDFEISAALHFSVLRRTTAFAASLVALVMIVLLSAR